MESSRDSSSGRAAFGLLELALLFVTPLAFYRGFSDQFANIKLIVMQSVVLIAALVMSLRFVWTGQRGAVGLRIALPAALLVLVALLSSVKSPTPAFSLIQAASFVCGPIWFIALLTSGAGESKMLRIAAMVTAASGIAAAIAVLQWVGHDPLLFGGYHVTWGTMRASMRLYSTFGNPNVGAGYLAGAVFLSAALTAIAKSPWARALAAVSSVLALAAVAGMNSQGAWLGLTSGLVVAFAVFMKRPATAFAFVALFLPASPMTELVREVFRSFEGRMFLWRASFPMFFEHPLLGSGWGVFQLRFPELQAQFLSSHPQYAGFWTYITDLHNDPLQILLEAGIIGLAALAWLLWTYGRELRDGLAQPSRYDRIWLAASAGGATAILVDACFNSQLAVPPTLILLFTLLAVPALLKPRSDVSESSGGQTRLLLRGVSTAIIVVAVAWLLLGVAHQAQADHLLAAGLEMERTGAFANAEDYFRKGLEEEPENGALQYALARALYLQGKHADALTYTLQAGRSIADPHLQVLKARIQDQMGNRVSALESYRHALWLDPDLPAVRADIERLTGAQ